MTHSSIAWMRLVNQRLTRTACTTPEDVVTWLGAVQAQDYPGATWGVGQRMTTATNAQLEAAFDEGRILRTHVLRPTWHFVPAADIRWMQALTAARVTTITRNYYRRHDLDDRVFTRARTVLERCLRDHTYLTRAQIATELQKARITGTPLRLGLLMMQAELDAIVCSGPKRGKQFTYALVAERAPNAMLLPRDEALATLTSRYFSSHGPATIRDYVWWSGLTVRDAKDGIAAVKPALEQLSLDGLTYFFQPTKVPRPPAAPLARLVPTYDESLIAYKDRGIALDLDASQKPPAAMDPYAAYLTIDGRLRGTWRRTITRDGISIAVTPFVKLTPEQIDAIEREADRYARFMGQRVTIAIATTARLSSRASTASRSK
jgi:hypothetical protein